MRPEDIRVPSRENIEATALEPGGRERLRSLQREFQDQRDEIERRGREFAARLVGYQEKVDDIRALRDILDGKLTEIAEVLGEVQP